MNYFLWNADSEIVSSGLIHLYWYPVLLLISYLLAIGLYRRMSIQDGELTHRADVVILCTLLISFVMARFGASLIDSGANGKNILTYIVPLQFKPTIQLTSLSLPAGVLGLLLSTFVVKLLFLKKAAYRKIMDILATIMVFTIGMISLGNFISSDYLGIPTNAADGTVHVGPIIKGIQELKCCIMRNPDGPNPLNEVTAKKADQKNTKEPGHRHMALQLHFKPEIEERQATEFVIGDVKTYLFEQSKYTIESGTEPIHYALSKSPKGHIVAQITTIGIARHPVRMYLSLICFILSWLAWQSLRGSSYGTGTIAGWIFFLFSISYFLLDFLTDHNTGISKKLGLSFGQWMIVPICILGLILLFKKQVKPEKV